MEYSAGEWGAEPLSLAHLWASPPGDGLWGAGEKTSFSQAAFQSCAYGRKKGNKVRVKGKQGLEVVRQETQSRAPGDHSSAVAHTAHSAAPQTAVRCWSQPTAPATWLWGCWAHLGVTVPGYTMEGWGEMHELLQEMIQGSFQPLKGRQQWDAEL